MRLFPRKAVRCVSVAKTICGCILPEMRRAIRIALRDSFIKFGLSEEDANDAIFKYRERYDIKGAEESEVFPEVPELLQKLKNWKSHQG